MSYKIEPAPSQKYHLHLHGEPENCQALQMSPPRRESFLDEGSWLVLVFAVWSGPDRKAIETALQIGRQFSSNLKVGLRPFDVKEELKTWCPEARLEWISPIWLLLQNGKLTAQRFGPQTPEAVRRLVTEYLVS